MPAVQTAPPVPLDDLIKSSAERSEKLKKGWAERSEKKAENSSAETSEKEVESSAETSEKKVKSSAETSEKKVNSSAEKENNEIFTVVIARKEDLWVSPGALGIRLKFAKADSTSDCGAEITRVDPRCAFKEQVAIGDRIVSVDDMKVASMEDVKANKDKVRKLGIVKRRVEKRPRSELYGEQTNPKSAKKAKGSGESSKKAKRSGESSKKAKRSGHSAKKAEGVIDLAKEDEKDGNPDKTANGSKNAGPTYRYPPPYHMYPHPPFPPTAYPHGYMVPRPGDAEPPQEPRRGPPPHGHFPVLQVPPAVAMGRPGPPAWGPFPRGAGVPPAMPAFPLLSQMGLTVNDPHAKTRRQDLLSELLQYNRLADTRTIAKMRDGKYYAVELGDEDSLEEADEGVVREKGMAWVKDAKYKKRSGNHPGNHPGNYPIPTYPPYIAWPQAAETKKKKKKAQVVTYHKIKPDPPGTPRKGNWKNKEDQVIIRAMQQHKETWGDIPFHNWSGLAMELNGRVGKQVRDRWTNNLDPKITKEPFNKKDDLKLWKAYQLNPKRWKDISAGAFKGKRSENQVKNRWNSSAFKKFVAKRFGKDKYKAEHAKAKQKVSIANLPSAVVGAGGEKMEGKDIEVVHEPPKVDQEKVDQEEEEGVKKRAKEEGEPDEKEAVEAEPQEGGILV